MLSNRCIACRFITKGLIGLILQVMSTDKASDANRATSGVHTSPFLSSFFAPAKLPKRPQDNSIDKPAPGHEHRKATRAPAHEQAQGSAHSSTRRSPVRTPFLNLFSAVFATVECMAIRRYLLQDWCPSPVSCSLSCCRHRPLTSSHETNANVFALIVSEPLLGIPLLI